jgi:transcriptional regulator with XRE-family HTH domain
MHELDQPDEPALVRRQLGRHLRRLRVAAGKTHADVETAGMGHRSTLWRIEAGRAKVRPSTVRALCWLYGVDPETSDTLYAMACRAATPGWWEEYQSDLPTWFTLYVELEAEARALSAYHHTVVDGLLQTADYARAVFAAGFPPPSAEDVERQVAIRLERQRRAFDRPLRLRVVLDESVLRREVGGPGVLAAQRDHLRALDEREGIEIRVLTFAAGAHPAVRGRFTILDLESEADPDVVYLEMINGGRYLEMPSELERYRSIFSMLQERATPLGEYP